MADEMDAILQGDDNSQASPAQNGQQSEPAQVNPTGQQSEEEVEFNSLSGNTQNRIKSIWARAREAEEALEAERAARTSYVPPAPGVTPDQKTALETLSNFGVATDEKVNQKISESFNQLRWDMEQTRLEGRYSGKNGTPQYVREEVEDYIRKHPQYMGYQAEDVFKYKMFPDEFSNVETQQGSRTGQSSTLRPTRAQVQSSTINSENVEEMVRTHDQQWYNDHIDEVNSAVSNHTKQFNQQGQRV